MVHAVMEQVQPGEILVLTMPEPEPVALIGELLATQALVRQVTGILATESASSVTLRRGEKAEDTILRTQIESIEATGKSLMPDGLEAQLTKQDVADLIAYLRAVAVPK